MSSYNPHVRIARVEITPATMAKDDPQWRFALGASSETHGFVVQVHTDEELTGLGYTTAVPHLGLTRESVEAGLRANAARLPGADPLNLAARLAELEGNNAARAGIDLALHDLAARALGVPLHRLLGGKVRDEVSLLRSLAIKTPTEMATIARRLVDEGYRHLKIKLEGDADADVARVAAIRAAVGPQVHLTVDANQSYRVPDAIQAVRRMEAYGIELVEQPVAADDVDGLAAVSRAVDTPVEADESASSVVDVFRLVAARAVDSVSLKLPKLGGLRPAREAAAICVAGGVRCRLGATVGSRLLAAAALHFVAATPELSEVCELGEFARLRDDPAEGLEVERGRLRVPTGLGVGVTLRATVTA